MLPCMSSPPPAGEDIQALSQFVWNCCNITFLDIKRMSHFCITTHITPKIRSRNRERIFGFLFVCLLTVGGETHSYRVAVILQAP